MSHKTKKLLRKLEKPNMPLSARDATRLYRLISARETHDANQPQLAPTRERPAFQPQLPQMWRVNEPLIVERPLRQIAIDGSMEQQNELIKQGINGNMPKHVLDSKAAKT